MSTTITSVTTQPVLHNPQVYGGDDRISSYNGFFGRFVAWERSPSSSCCPSAVKAWILFSTHKALEFLDWIGIGRVLCNEGLVKTKSEYQFLQTGEERNRLAREKVIEALGGPAACNQIPVISLQSEDLQPALFVNDHHFTSGQWAVQGEDPAGRKFIALRLADRATQELHIVTIHQAYRETAWGHLQNGRFWRINDSCNPNLGSTSLDLCVELIRDIRENGSARRIVTNGFIGNLTLQHFIFDRAPKL